MGLNFSPGKFVSVWLKEDMRLHCLPKFPGCRSEEFLDDVRIVRAGGRYSVYWKAKEYYKKRFSREGYDVVIDEINTRPFLTPRF